MTAGRDMSPSGWHLALGAAACAIVATLAACGGGGSSADVVAPPPADTTTLVGRWTGSLESVRYGYATITTVLRADSTMTQEAEGAVYPPLSGTWSVSATEFTVTGRDRNGIIVLFVAPLSRTRLTGRWSSISGAGGTFTMAKQ